MSQPVVSICIPIYNRTDYLKRLLDSIAVQSYQKIEVIITDDTRDDRIAVCLNQLNYAFPLTYIHNEVPQGTPSNWMVGMSHAKGEWIKIMHDDDFFTSPDSLQQFVSQLSADADCIFSGYLALYESSEKKIDQTISLNSFQRILKHSYRLFASNVIGPPSVLMFRKTMQELYDPAFKWLVDLEAYIRMINRYKCIYITRPLITMSYNETQVTNECFRNPDVEIYEALLYYQKHGSVVFEDWVSFDGWWRLIRNLSIRSVSQLMQYARGLPVPQVLHSIISFQSLIPSFLLRLGLFSKFFMFLSYCLTSRRGFRHHH